MHPAHALEGALQGRPADVHDFLAALPPEAGFPAPRLTRDDPGALDTVTSVEQSIVAKPRASARPLAGSSVLGWGIHWSAGSWMLYGHLFANAVGEPDPVSPLLLVNSSTLEVFYGPELAQLARRVLADSLAWHALRGQAFD